MAHLRGIIPRVPFIDDFPAGNHEKGIGREKSFLVECVSIELFRENNIPIQSELSVMQQQFGVISGKMMIEVNGKEYTLQQAAKFHV